MERRHAHQRHHAVPKDQRGGGGRLGQIRRRGTEFTARVDTVEGRAAGVPAD
ncbi:hypothetical protein [Micromonospora sp. LOL_024]|uniref:hypothetical protein n=1 Tax=Micromonospora sp. LOL_024 TaxID=3345412 RepID=UPI003A8A2C7A